MKKAISLIVIISLIFVFYGCSSNNSLKSVNLVNISKELIEADKSLPEMVTVSDNDDNPENNLKSVSDIDYSKVKSFAISYSASGKADEIVIIELKSENDVSDCVSSLNKHIEKRTRLYETYDAEQAKRMDNSNVFSYGQYAVLIISDNSASLKNQFENYFK